MFKFASVALLLALGLTGCGNTHTKNYGGPTMPAEKSTSQGGSKSTALKASSSDLGKIIVDGKGRTVYTYADDDQGTAKSSCKKKCLAAWPPVPAAKNPGVDGLSGDVGVTKTADGRDQLTYAGWPLYYFSGDMKASDTKGQGMEGEWYVLNPKGEKVKSSSGGQQQSSSGGQQQSQGY